MEYWGGRESAERAQLFLLFAYARQLGCGLFLHASASHTYMAASPQSFALCLLSKFHENPYYARISKVATHGNKMLQY